MVITLIFGILIFISLIIVYFFNHLLFYKNKVQKKYNKIKGIVEKEHECLGKMSEYIEKNLKNETNLLRKIKGYQKDLLNIKEENFFKTINKVNKVLPQFKKLKEVYPNLKNKNSYQDIIHEFELIETSYHYAKNVYDEELRDYNAYREQRFLKSLSKLFRLKDYDTDH